MFHFSNSQQSRQVPYPTVNCEDFSSDLNGVMFQKLKSSLILQRAS